MNEGTYYAWNRRIAEGVTVSHEQTSLSFFKNVAHSSNTQSYQ